MSAKIMGKAWELDLPANKLLVLLAMADHADHNGDNIFPGMALIAYKTGYSERQVKRIVAAMVKDGILVEHKGRSRYGTKMYSINLDAGNAKPPYQSDKMSHSQSDNLTPSESDNMSLHEIESDKVTLPQSDILSTRSDIAMSPKPSIEPSIKEHKNGHIKSDPVFTIIAREIFGIEGKITDTNIRGRINGICKTARTTFEDQFGVAPDDKVSNAVVQFGLHCDRKQMIRPKGRDKFGTNFAEFLQLAAKKTKRVISFEEAKPALSEEERERRRQNTLEEIERGRAMLRGEAVNE